MQMLFVCIYITTYIAWTLSQQHVRVSQTEIHFFRSTAKHYQLCIPIDLQFSVLFALTNVSKYEIRNQEVYETYISRLYALFDLLAMMAFWEFLNEKHECSTKMRTIQPGVFLLTNLNF